LISINSLQSALEALDHEDAGVRYHSAWWLGKHRAVEAVPKLVECLRDEREITSTGGYPLRRQAARSLGMIKDSYCIPELLKTLKTDDIQLHEATLRALIEIKSDQSTHSLLDYLERNIENKPIEALIEALTEHKAWQISEKIRPFLSSESERVVSSAATFFFSCTGEIIYLDKIISLLDHHNRFVMQSAAFDLARIGTIEAAQPILESKIPNNIKMFVIKSILSKSLTGKSKTTSIPQSEQKLILNSLLKKLDNLIRENFSGNLLIEQDEQSADNYLAGEQTTQDEFLADAFKNLRAPSLVSREAGIEKLIRSADSFKINLVDLYFLEPDQDIKMGLIKVMAVLRRPLYAKAFIDAIGVEIGNHCQGNIRRVAVCALGEIKWSKNGASEAVSAIIKKLAWTLQSPEDWGLRYGACLALEGISNANSIELLINAKEKEPDPVIRMRIELALSTCKTKEFK